VAHVQGKSRRASSTEVIRSGALTTTSLGDIGLFYGLKQADGRRDAVLSHAMVHERNPASRGVA